MHAARVLIVEDSLSIALTYRVFLERENHSAVIAHTAEEARKLLAASAFSIVLLDLNLPDGNGIDFLETIRKAGNQTPVVVITADPSIDNAVRAVREGAQDFIVKPVTFESLVELVKDLDHYWFQIVELPRMDN